ncbi:hypothetical protein FVEG_00053 [Fusarium verticillioides 7600]|uniref:Uncharacterized protein n=2 Tax=Fusarium fujikuroi species complex TaxID=171627 RepID=W7LTE5_GIBM7|nr:hypothetical protein FVEG_00053 [Fusarium verticillioides 7600]EWG35852.1 hypothetical protein FVEG_00053 [Fusarium verticillioides 7600]
MAENMQVGRLDLASRAIDLTTVLLRATSSSGSLLKGAWEIGQWLGRERLNQYELLDCMEKAKGFAFANQTGQQFFDKIIQGLDTLPVRPLFLQHSGSLGRLMAGDPNLSWIVSTVACLFQHHRDDMLVTETVTACIMESHRLRGQEHDIVTRDAFMYDPEHTRVRAVVRKIVSSVWYNVVNVGCDTVPLPDELLAVCSRGHYLDPADFGIVVNTIYARCPSKAILRTTHLLRDVMLWLLLHYDGAIVVNVGGHIVYRADFGNPLRELEVNVASPCPDQGHCSGGHQASYQILRNVSGRFEDFLTGYFYSDHDSLPQPGIRQQLYEIPRLYPRASPMWNEGVRIVIKCTAQSIMQWLLSVPLSPQTDSPGFSAEPLQRAADGEMTVSLALGRVPSILSLQWGSSFGPPITFKSLAEVESTLRMYADLGMEAYVDHRLITLVEFFPILKDMASKVATECRCSECTSLKEGLGLLKIRSLKLGCLYRFAVEEALLLIAHGVADGFCVDTASSVSDPTHIIKGMTTLLLELMEDRKVLWDTWFAVASCVYLGCPFQKPVEPTDPAFGGTAFAAIQYGDLAAQAPWLDLTRKLSARGCFRLVGSNGRLGVVTRRHDDVQFRSVEENFAIIETENTEDTSHFCSRYKKAALLIDHSLSLDLDETSVKTDVILSHIDDKFYRLSYRVQTKNHWRIMDPSDALSAVIRMSSSAICQHNGQPPEIAPLNAKVYTMDEVVGRWPDVVRSSIGTTGGRVTKSGIFHLTHILDTHLKSNIALALTVCPVAVPNYPDTVCTTCMLDHAGKAERKPYRDGEAGDPADRYIINLRTNLTGQDVSIRRRLIVAK